MFIWNFGQYIVVDNWESNKSKTDLWFYNKELNIFCLLDLLYLGILDTTCNKYVQNKSSL
jgi:hypothetical protein